MKRTALVWTYILTILVGLAGLGFAIFWIFWGTLEEVKECFYDNFSRQISTRFFAWLIVGLFIIIMSIFGLAFGGKAKNAKKIRNSLIWTMICIIVALINNARYNLEYFIEMETAIITPEIVLNGLKLIAYLGLGFFALALVALTLNIMSLSKVNTFIKKEVLKQINEIAAMNGGTLPQNVVINTARFGENSQVKANTQERVRSQAEIENDRKALKNKIGEEKLANAKKLAREYKQKLDSGVFTQQEYNVLMAQLKKDLLNN